MLNDSDYATILNLRLNESQNLLLFRIILKTFDLQASLVSRDLANRLLSRRIVRNQFGVSWDVLNYHESCLRIPVSQ